MRSYLLIFLCLFGWGCSQKLANPVSSGLRYLSASEGGDLIEVEAFGYADRKDEVLADGLKRIMKALIETGLPDSPYRTPLVPDASARDEHHVALAALVNERYDRFVTQADLITTISRARRDQPFSATVRAAVNVDGLKRYLQKQGILSRYGI